MFIKAAFKESSFIVQILIVISVFVFGMLSASMLSLLFLSVKDGISLEALYEMLQNVGDYPSILRQTQFFGVIGQFIFPSIVCAWLFSDNHKEYLQIDNPIQPSIAIWAFVSILVSIPFFNFAHYLNQQMVFPEALRGLEDWMRAKEESTAQLLEKMLYAENIGILLFNIGVVAILTGIGEEFMFRGLLQKMFEKFIKNPHTIIWIVAIIFSTIHFQFYGFLPRMLLGAYFGYLLYYTKTMWIPVLAHFTFNCFGVVSMYIFQDSPQEIQEMDALGTGSTWWMAVASLALFAFCFSKIRLNQIKGTD
jgi:CAAX amino terminal protease family.